MVSKLTSADELAIADIIRQAEERTTAKISIVVLPASDHYRDFVLFYGFMLGTFASLTLWLCNPVIFPWLLAVQLSIMALVDLVPSLRHLCVRLVPRQSGHHRAAARAHRDYFALHAALPKDEPFALLFVSLAERYVHVVTNPVVHKEIPDSWNKVTDRFIELIRKENLRTACIQTIEQMAGMLTLHFPKR